MTFLASLLTDAGIELPREGWAGRRRAIARAWLALTVQAVLFLLSMAAIFGAVLIVAAAMDVLP